MIGVTLKQLRYFDALARRLHFGRAADDCGVSQPALSMQIQDLELRLGGPLVERTRTGVQLTNAGVEVARRAARVLADVRDLMDSVRREACPLTGALRLGVIPTVAPYLLPPLLPLLREAHPDCELHLRETHTSILLRELQGGELDVLLLALPVEHPEIETAKLFEDRFLLALPASLGEPPADAFATLAKGKLLLLEEGHCFRSQALDFCGERRVHAVNTLGASSLSTLVQMVANGYGVTLLPETCLDVEVWRGQGPNRESNRRISLARFREPEPFRTLGLAWRPTSPRRIDFEALGKLICMVWEQRGCFEAPEKRQ